jgi:hypothetical protein
MTVGKLSAVALGFGLALTAGVASAGNPAILSGYTFDSRGNPARTTCVPVKGKLLSELSGKAWWCDASGDNRLAKPSVKCVRKSPKGTYLIFKTRALCDAERKLDAWDGD